MVVREPQGPTWKAFVATVGVLFGSMFLALGLRLVYPQETANAWLGFWLLVDSIFESIVHFGQTDVGTAVVLIIALGTISIITFGFAIIIYHKTRRLAIRYRRRARLYQLRLLDRVDEHPRLTRPRLYALEVAVGLVAIVTLLWLISSGAAGRLFVEALITLFRPLDGDAYEVGRSIGRSIGLLVTAFLVLGAIAVVLDPVLRGIGYVRRWIARRT